MYQAVFLFWFFLFIFFLFKSWEIRIQTVKKILLVRQQMNMLLNLLKLSITGKYFRDNSLSHNKYDKTC